MPMECALLYKDAKGIVGGNPKTGREDTSVVVEVHHVIESPRDRQTGLASGHRTHGTYDVLKPLDKATPLLFKTLTRNEELPELVLNWYEITPAGEEQIYFTTTLRDVRIFKIETILPNTKDPALAPQVHLERVSFGYREIEWSYLADGIMHVDSWRPPAG